MTSESARVSDFSSMSYLQLVDIESVTHRSYEWWNFNCI